MTVIAADRQRQLAAKKLIDVTLVGFFRGKLE
jgi:hypothetical protein